MAQFLGSGGVFEAPGPTPSPSRTEPLVYGIQKGVGLTHAQVEAKFHVPEDVKASNVIAKRGGESIGGAPPSPQTGNVTEAYIPGKGVVPVDQAGNPQYVSGEQAAPTSTEMQQASTKGGLVLPVVKSAIEMFGQPGLFFGKALSVPSVRDAAAKAALFGARVSTGTARFGAFNIGGVFDPYVSPQEQFEQKGGDFYSAVARTAAPVLNPLVQTGKDIVSTSQEKTRDYIYEYVEKTATEKVTGGNGGTGGLGLFEKLALGGGALLVLLIILGYAWRKNE